VLLEETHSRLASPGDAVLMVLEYVPAFFRASSISGMEITAGS
jgi:hypothetical protein